MPNTLTKQQASERLVKLREEVAHHRYLYHVLDRQEISDGALDSLKKEIENIEEQYPELITPTSPTQRVGGKPLAKFKQIEHGKRMLSLQDAFTLDDLESWEKRNKKIVDAPYDYFIESKIDGVALALRYENGELTKGITRGDGQVGEDVTLSIKTIEAIPLILRGRVGKTVEVRGEVYILKKDFEAMNKQRAKEGQSVFANPRNIAAGSIRQLDPKLAAARPLRFFAWEITEGVTLTTRQEEYAKLQELGFPVPPKAQHVTTIKALWQHLQKEETKRDKAPFLIDGAVIKIDDLALNARLGSVGKAPRGSIAFKYAAEEATTVVEDIVVQVGRTGALTPVAHLRPVQVAGTTVSRASLHNADEVQRKDVRIGDTVIIHKAGDIIPEVLKVIVKLRPTKTQAFVMSKVCPVCHSTVVKEQGGAIHRCSNKKCFLVQREQISHAVGRAGFDIEGLGEKIVEQLLQEGLIHDAADIFDLQVGDLLPLERFAAKSASNLIDEIKAKKSVGFIRFIIALGIPNVGAITAQDMAQEFRTLDQLVSANEEDLTAIEGIGDKVATSIIDFFKDPETKELLEKYTEHKIAIQSPKSSGPLTGKTFLFTGSLPDMSRDEAKQRVINQGGKVVSTVGQGVDFVVAGEEVGSKYKKAQELQLTILTPQQFKRKIA